MDELEKTVERVVQEVKTSLESNMKIEYPTTRFEGEEYYGVEIWKLGGHIPTRKNDSIEVYVSTTELLFIVVVQEGNEKYWSTPRGFESVPNESLYLTTKEGNRFVYDKDESLYKLNPNNEIIEYIDYSNWLWAVHKFDHKPEIMNTEDIKKTRFVSQVQIEQVIEKYSFLKRYYDHADYIEISEFDLEMLDDKGSINNYDSSLQTVIQESQFFITSNDSDKIMCLDMEGVASSGYAHEDDSYFKGPTLLEGLYSYLKIGEPNFIFQTSKSNQGDENYTVLYLLSEVDIYHIKQKIEQIQKDTLENITF